MDSKSRKEEKVIRDLFELVQKYPNFSNKIYTLFRWFIYPFDKLEAYLPNKGAILDIGCGVGTFSVYSSLKNNSRQIYGIDTDKKRIIVAKKASQNIKNVQFFKMSAFNWHKKLNAIVLCYVFHHFPGSKQTLFLEKAYKLLNKNGLLIIKEINKDDFIRSKLSRLWDFILYPKDKINYWSRNKLISYLESMGFEVVNKREAILFPGSTIFYICTKK